MAESYSHGSVRRVNPDAEAARLAGERKRMQDIACRFCGAKAPIPLMNTSDGWQCFNGADCFHRQPGPGDG